MPLAAKEFFAVNHVIQKRARGVGGVGRIGVTREGHESRIAAAEFVHFEERMALPPLDLDQTRGGHGDESGAVASYFCGDFGVCLLYEVEQVVPGAKLAFVFGENHEVELHAGLDLFLRVRGVPAEDRSDDLITGEADDAVTNAVIAEENETSAGIVAEAHGVAVSAAAESSLDPGNGLRRRLSGGERFRVFRKLLPEVKRGHRFDPYAPCGLSAMLARTPMKKSGVVKRRMLTNRPYMNRITTIRWYSNDAHAYHTPMLVVDTKFAPICDGFGAFSHAGIDERGFVFSLQKFKSVFVFPNIGGM